MRSRTPVRGIAADCPPPRGGGRSAKRGRWGSPRPLALEGCRPQENCFAKESALSFPGPAVHLMATRPSALLVIRMDSSGFFTVPIRARMQSIFSGTTSASWWIAWKQ